MFKKHIDVNIEHLDIQIGGLLVKIGSEDGEQDYEKNLRRLEELVDIRSELADSRNRESNRPMIISGAVQVASILMVLQYEKTDVVTSKVFGIATKLFKEG